jgi:hypothetical protein
MSEASKKEKKANCPSAIDGGKCRLHEEQPELYPWQCCSPEICREYEI